MAVEKYRKKTGRAVKIVYTAHDYQLICPSHGLFDNDIKVCEKCLSGNYTHCFKTKCVKNSRLKSLLGMLDAYFVPVDRSQQMYGVEIHANVIQAFMENKTLTVLPAVVDGLIATIIVIALMLICENLSAVKVVIVCVVSAVVKLIMGFVLFNIGFTSNVLVAPIMSVIIGIYYIVLQYYRARVAKKSIEKAFSKYVDPQVIDDIAKNGTYELKLGGENRDIAVLFVDIRGFTPLSESLEPEQVVDILNEYLELTTASIFKHGGTLDKFIGDATMGVFNAPFNADDYVYKAVLAAWDIVQGGNRLEKDFLEKYGKRYKLWTCSCR